MRWNDLLVEFGAATVAPHINLSAEQIKYLPQIGMVDSTPVYGATFYGHNIVAFVNNDIIQSAVIFDQNNNLRGVQNSSNTKGAVTTLMLYVLNHFTEKLTITKTEPLTPDGLKWVCGILSSNRKLFSIVDHTGKIPDQKELKAAWDQSWEQNFAANDIELHITARPVDRALFENEQRLMPIYRFLHGEY
jgi:hypothetical protein